MPETDQYAQQIETAIPNARATVAGSAGKFEATVVSDAFEGQTLLAKHRLVNAALADRLQSGEIHALSIRAYTPAEWEAVGS